MSNIDSSYSWSSCDYADEYYNMQAEHIVEEGLEVFENDRDYYPYWLEKQGDENLHNVIVDIACGLAEAAEEAKLEGRWS